MKVNIDKNSSIYSFDNLDNYNENLNNTSNEIIKKYCEIICEFLKIIFEKIKIKKNNYCQFIILRGVDTVTNVFNIMLYYTKNLDMTYYHCQKSYYYYVEFIEQISYDQHIFLQLTSRDACNYVYKKNIFELNKDIKKNMDPIKKEVKIKFDIVNEYTFIFKYILETAICKIDLENKSSEIKIELIDKLDAIYESIYLLNLDVQSIEIICKCFELINKFNFDIEHELYLEIIFNILNKCSKNTSKHISNIEKNIHITNENKFYFDYNSYDLDRFLNCFLK
jgi:hypothetical protein